MGSEDESSLKMAIVGLVGEIEGKRDGRGGGGIGRAREREREED